MDVEYRIYTWDHIRDFGYGKPYCQLIDPLSKEVIRSNLLASEVDIIDRVWKRFKNFSAGELSRMTHEPGTPWFNAYFHKGRNAELPNTDIKNYYIRLAMAGRAQASEGIQ